jgi:hypothetical protein
MNRQGVVTAVGPPLQVRFDGDNADSQVLRVTSYTATLGDRVILSQWGRQWIVLGKVAT